MGKALFCFCALTLLGLGTITTFQLMHWLQKHLKNEVMRDLVAPIIAGLSVGAIICLFCVVMVHFCSPFLYAIFTM